MNLKETGEERCILKSDPKTGGYKWHKIEWPLFCSASWEEGCWFRIFGWGLHFTKSFPTFSERNGYTVKLKLWGNWRMGFLGPSWTGSIEK